MFQMRLDAGASSSACLCNSEDLCTDVSKCCSILLCKNKWSPGQTLINKNTQNNESHMLLYSRSPSWFVPAVLFATLRLLRQALFGGTYLYSCCDEVDCMLPLEPAVSCWVTFRGAASTSTCPGSPPPAAGACWCWTSPP